MNQNIYSIYDSKTCVFATPFFAFNNATAIRSFADVANDPNTSINKHPEDFSLHHIGKYDDDNGLIEAVTQTNLGLAADYNETIT